MNKYKIELFDGNFPDAPSSVMGKSPECIEYVRLEAEYFEGVALFTDEFINSPLVDSVWSKYKIGWLHEPYCLHPQTYEHASENASKFDLILTYHKPFLESHSNAEFCPYGGIWIPRDRWGLHPKSKDLSMLIGAKKSADGHLIRHDIARTFEVQRLDVDFYGIKGEKVDYSWETKVKVLSDYRFSIVTETCREDNLFTEWLLDCFVVGTVPVFWGCPNVGDFFDTEGIVSFSNLSELLDVYRWLNQGYYESMLPHIKNNFHLAQDYEITDDWIYRYVIEGNYE